MAIYFERHSKNLNTFCWQNVGLLDTKGGDYTVMTSLKG